MPFTASRTRSSGVRRALRIGVAIVAAGSLAALSACSSSGSGSSSSASSGSTVTIVEPDNNMGWSVDYAFSGLEQETNTQATLLEKPYVKTSQTGVETQDSSKFEPYLAKSMTVSPDGLTYTFKLRHVISAQGNPLTAEDVKWSFERKYNAPTSITYGAAAPAWYDPDKQIKVIDNDTVQFTLTSAGYGTTFKALNSDLLGQIYDSKYLKAHATTSDPWAVKFSTTHPNYGFGPYKVTTWNASTGATLVARKNTGLPHPPKVDKVIVRVVPDNGARVTAVESGTADIAENVDPASSAQAATNSSVIVPKVKDSNQYIEFPLVTNKAPFNNQLVRQAMAYAVPYDKIIKNVFHGLAVRNGSGFLDRQAPGYTDAGLPDYSYDPAKAKALLAQAGVTTPVPYTLTVSASDADMVNTAIQIQSAAASAGFTVTIDKVNQSQFNQGRNSHSPQAFLLRDYAITMTPGYELQVYTAKGSGNNLADWEDQSFYDAVNAGYTFPDQFSTEAGQAWNKAEQIWINSASIVFIGQTQPNVLLNKSVGGWASRSDQWMDYSNLTVSH